LSVFDCISIKVYFRKINPMHCAGQRMGRLYGMAVLVLLRCHALVLASDRTQATLALDNAKKVIRQERGKHETIVEIGAHAGFKGPKGVSLNERDADAVMAENATAGHPLLRTGILTTLPIMPTRS
jgi:hypothetical protein